jgi:hypothetical protein
VICKGCLKKRPCYEIQARVPCNECGSKETEIQDYTEKKMVLEILRKQIKKVKNWKMEID